jgi:processive 1,2-diacylglycerol beta-glucosyltransferase
MRVLILSASTGGGHNSTAEALADQFAKMNVSTETVDVLAFISEKAAEIISRGHTYLYRNMPKLFGFAYRLDEQMSPKFIYDYVVKGAPALQEKLLSESFDAVVCTHVFSGMVISEVRKRYGNNIPAFFVATDYTATPGVADIHVDGYFVPHRMLFGEFIRAQTPADKLFATGIPVRGAFYGTEDKAEARRLLGLPADARILLLSCGSMGCGNLDRQALKLCEELPDHAHLVVLCGSNERFYEKLIPHASDRMSVVGFSKQVPLYMTASDLYLTKPGGLSTSEAIVKRLPMVLINAVPGCETRNFDFLTQCGVAMGAKSWKEAISFSVEALADDEKIAPQREAMQEFQPIVAAEQICRYVVGKS